MLRLDLKDKDSTVLFVDVMNGIKIHKSQSKVLYDDRYELNIETSSDVCHVIYDSAKHRDVIYDYVLNKINEYLFPQIETTGFKPICPNDAAMPEYLRKPKE